MPTILKTKKGFAALGIIAAIGLSAVVALIVGSFAAREIYRDKPARFGERQEISDALGAATLTSGFNYPTSTYSFSDDDIINAGDFNNVLTYLGTRNSTATLSVSYLLRSATSVNPGHLHTTSGISSTIAVAQGGTATGTFTYGVVIASSTNAFTTIVPGANDNLLQASSGRWISSVPPTFVASALAFSAVSSTQKFDTASTTFTNIGTSTVASTTMTLIGAHRVLLTLTGHWSNSGANATYFTFTVDGNNIGGSQGLIGWTPAASAPSPINLVYISEPLSVASHTFRAQVYTDAGTVTINDSSGNKFWLFSATELYN